MTRWQVVSRRGGRRRAETLPGRAPVRLEPLARAPDPGNLRRLRRVRHRAVLAVRGVHRHRRAWLVEEDDRGVCLEVWSRRGSLPVSVGLAVAEEVALALSAVAPLRHGDVGPGTVWISERGEVGLGCWGGALGATQRGTDAAGVTELVRALCGEAVPLSAEVAPDVWAAVLRERRRRTGGTSLASWAATEVPRARCGTETDWRAVDGVLSTARGGGGVPSGLRWLALGQGLLAAVLALAAGVVWRVPVAAPPSPAPPALRPPVVEAAPPAPPAPPPPPPPAPPRVRSRAPPPVTRVAVASPSPKGLRLQGSDGVEHRPGRLPPGTYKVRAPFGGRVETWATVGVRAGQQLSLACASRRPVCQVVGGS